MRTSRKAIAAARQTNTQSQRLALSEVRGEMTVHAMRTLRMLLESDDDSIKLKAAKAILDRSLGKPVQAVLVDSSAPELATRSAADREAALLAALRAVRNERKVVVDANTVPAIEKKSADKG